MNFQYLQRKFCWSLIISFCLLRTFLTLVFSLENVPVGVNEDCEGLVEVQPYLATFEIQPLKQALVIEVPP